MKKFLSVILAILMIITIVPSAFAATDKVVADEFVADDDEATNVLVGFEITQQPTAADPTVKLNVDTDATYQWYFIEETLTEITTENGTAYSYNGETAVYDAEIGWTPIPDEMEEYGSVTVSLDAGDKLTIVVPENFTATDWVGIYDFESGEGTYENCSAGKTSYVFAVDVAGNYTVRCSTSMAVKVYEVTGEIKALDGETEATLKNPVIGNTYFCEITMGTNTYTSGSFEYDYAITQQPTAEDPTVKLNMDTGATYQWCDVTNDEEITDKNATAYSYNTVTATYSSESGWTGVLDSYNEYSYVTIPLEKGESVSVYILSGSIASGDNIGIYDYENNNGDGSTMTSATSYEFTAPADGDYTVYTTSSLNIKVYSAALGEEAVNGETEATLKNPEIGKKYKCKVTTEAGTVLSTNLIEYPYEITQQPTTEDPTVKINDGTNAKYQWYTVEGGKEEITNSTSGISLDSPVSGMNGSIAYSDGYWYPVYTLVNSTTLITYYFTLDMKAGDEMSVEFLVAPNTVLLGDFEAEEAITGVADSKNPCLYTFTVTNDATYTLAVMFDISLVPSPDFLRVKAYKGTQVLTAIDGETKETLQNSEMGNIYLCKVTAADGTVLKSDVADYSYKIIGQPTAADPTVKLNYETEAAYQWYTVSKETTEITDKNAQAYGTATYSSEIGWTPSIDINNNSQLYFSVDLQAGDVLDINFSAAPEMIMLQESGAVIYVTGTTYSCTVPADGTYTLIAYYQNSQITAKAIVKGSKLAALDGETNATLQNPEIGKAYVCEVTTENNTVLESKTFTYDYAISHQPTGDEPYVELNENDEGATYKWYTVSGDLEYITDTTDNVVKFTPPVLGISGSISYQNRYWTPATSEFDEEVLYAYYFTLDMKTGDTFNVEFAVAPLDTVMYETTDGQSAIIGVADSNNPLLYTFTATSDVQCILSAAYNSSSISDSSDLLVKAYTGSETLTAVDSETKATLENPVKDTRYICEITLSNSDVLLSDVFTAKCLHKKAADDGNCTTAVICPDCNDTVIEEKESHTVGTAATCISAAVCDVCKMSYGPVDDNNHSTETVIKNKKDATVTEDGYTGDTHCKDCDAKLESGNVIPATGTNNDPADDCDHICHKDGILGFFWKLIRFFQQLFGIQQYCDCGILHW